MARRLVTVDGADPVHLSTSMVHGLRIVHRHDGRARRSNFTAGSPRPTVYWQAADQLATAGLVDLHGEILSITPLGTRIVYAIEAGDG